MRTAIRILLDMIINVESVSWTNGKEWGNDGNKCLMFCGNELDEVLDKVKKTLSTAKFDKTKILIDTDDKLLDDIILKNKI